MGKNVGKFTNYFTMNEAETLKNIEKKLAVIASLLIDSRNRELGEVDRSQAPKLELLLASAGLKSVEIAELTGKKLSAVQKALERARKQK